MNYNSSSLDIPKAVAKIALSPIPVFGSAIAELINYLDAKYIQKRIESLEHTVDELSIHMDDFIVQACAVEDDEHRYYVVRNGIKHLCLSALPETVNAYNRALIAYIMKQSALDMTEYAMEILQQLNAGDIFFLQSLKDFQSSADKRVYKEKQDAAKADEGKPGWRDRNVSFGETNTVFWRDYAAFLHLNENISDMGQLLNRECLLHNKDKDEATQIFAVIARAIIKSQSLGVLQCDYIVTLGTTSQNNIDRFHITFFGQKVLEYIDLEKGDKPNADA